MGEKGAGGGRLKRLRQGVFAVRMADSSQGATMATTRATPAPSLKESMTPQNVARELREAVAELVRENPEFVEQFDQAYKERGTIPGLPESNVGIQGVTETLAGLLVMFPEEGKERSQASVGAMVDSEHVAALVRIIDVSFDRLAEEHPSTLILFKKHQEADGRETRHFLAALLRMYSHHAVGYPF